MNLNQLLEHSISGNSISENGAYFFMSSIMKGEVSEILLSSFLTSIKMRGETKEELLGFVKAMREVALRPNQALDFKFLDTCGTGGDGKNSINISTLSALNLGSMGVKVAKHGNRAVSSNSGSSDLLFSMGYNIQKPIEESIKLLVEKNFCFLFAPIYHPSMKFAAEVRKQLAMKTVFNILGPLSNPFSPKFQVMGVYTKELFPKVSYVLSNLVEKAILCHSKDGFDEFSIFDDTDYIFIDKGKVTEHEFKISNLDLPNLNPEEIFTKSKEESFFISEKILNGDKLSGSHQVALNSGVALFLMEETNSIEEGYKSSLKNLHSGAVKKYLVSLKN